MTTTAEEAAAACCMAGAVKLVTINRRSVAGKGQVPVVEMPDLAAVAEQYREGSRMKKDGEALMALSKADLLGPLEAERVRLSRQRQSLVGSLNLSGVLTYTSKCQYALTDAALDALRAAGLAGPAYIQRKTLVLVDLETLPAELQAALAAHGATATVEYQALEALHAALTLDPVAAEVAERVGLKAVQSLTAK